MNYKKKVICHLWKENLAKKILVHKFILYINNIIALIEVDRSHYKEKYEF